MATGPAVAGAEAGRRRSWWWKLAVVLIPGCGGTAEIADFVHPPTADLHQGYDLQAADVAPFKVGEVVVAPRFVAVDHANTAVKLIAASRTAGQLTVRGARLSGAGGASKAWAESHEIALADSPDDKVYKGFVTVGQLPNTELESLSGGSPLTLSLDLRSGESERTIDFEIARQVRKYVVSP